MSVAAPQRFSFGLLLQPKFLIVALFGFSSGLPLALTMGTLIAWMSFEGVDLSTIGFFASVQVPYNIKFLWSPIVDQIKLPILDRLLGRRRSWLLLTQVLTGIAIIALGSTEPTITPVLTAFFAVVVSSLSATQDIAVDAYRIEILEKYELGVGTSIYVYGYRIAMLVAGAGSLYLAEAFDWHTAYYIMGALMGVGILTTLLSPEPSNFKLKPKRPPAEWIQDAVIKPFGEFLKRDGAILILLFLILFKVGDSVAGFMTTPFLVELGFTKIEIANISKFYGVIATLVGVGLGGIIVSKLGFFKGLLIAGILQMVTNFVFIAQGIIGHDLAFLAFTIGVENLAGGIGTAMFAAYIAGLCNIKYTATQFALFSALAAVPRTIVNNISGVLAEWFGWTLFFAVTAVFAIPGIALLFVIRKYSPIPETDVVESKKT